MSNDAENYVIIGQGTKKRTIRFPFGICGSRKAVEALRDSCQKFLDDPGNGHGISYGWFRIDAPQKEEWIYGPTGTQPDRWED